MTAPQPKQTIASMLSYRPSFGAPSGGRLIRLSANEGALGCSPKALEALQLGQIEPVIRGVGSVTDAVAASAIRELLDNPRAVELFGEQELQKILNQ